MSKDKRPGGLTALAVLNFVFGGLGVLGVLALWAILAIAQAAIAAGGTSSTGLGMLYATFLLTIVSVTLLIAAGVGYLGQKRFLGRTLGTVYAVTSLAATGLSLATGTPFGIGTVIGLVYPVLTLILLNSTFKDDLVN
jgi:hypothetical protein